MMPPRGAIARGDHAATLQTVHHERLTDPELARLLDVLEPWAAGEDPDADDVRLIRELRRDVEKAVRVPTSLAADMSRAAALGQAAWEAARAAADYGRFRDALARHLELRHRYVECFTGYEHPYDVLLDDFEPEMTTARLRPLFASLREALVPLVEATAGPLVLPVRRRGRRGVAAARGDDGPRGRRLRPGRLAARRRPAPVRAGARPRRRPRHDALRPARLRGRLLRRAARVRPRPLRGADPGAARPQPARQPRLARRARVAEPAVGEPRRAQPRVLHLGGAAAGRRSCPASTTSTRRSSTAV